MYFSQWSRIFFERIFTRLRTLDRSLVEVGKHLLVHFNVFASLGCHLLVVLCHLVVIFRGFRNLHLLCEDRSSQCEQKSPGQQQPSSGSVEDSRMAPTQVQTGQATCKIQGQR
jgi:hypothetical protein